MLEFVVKGLKKEDVTLDSVVKKTNDSVVQTHIQEHSPDFATEKTAMQNNTLKTDCREANFVRIKPVVPITIAEIPDISGNRVIEAIKKSNAYKCESTGSITRIETNSRIYEVNGYGRTCGLILYVNMENLKWKLHIKGVVEYYKNNHVGDSNISVIAIIKSASNSDNELRELEEIELRDSLTATNIYKERGYKVL